MEAHPEENLHAMVQRAPEGTEAVCGGPFLGPERWRALDRPHRSSRSQGVGPLQQKAASLCAEDGERTISTGFSD